LFWRARSHSQKGRTLNRDLLIGDVFRNAARAVPGRVAAALGDDELTFGQLDSSANRTARALSRLGAGTGDRIVVWSTTTLDTLPVFAAAAKRGMVFAPIDAGLGPAEARELAATVHPAIVVVDRDRAERGAELADALTAVPVDLTGLAGTGALGREPRDPAVRGLAELASGEDDDDVTDEELRESDPHVIFFTSGSTGQPKGVVISHRASWLRTCSAALLEPRGAMVCPYPLFHMGAWTIAMQQWQARDRVVLVASFDGATVCAAIERHRATRINGIPAIWRRLLDYKASPEGRGVDLSSLRMADTGTSATPPELLAAIRSLLPGAGIRIFYGSTEAGPVAMLEDRDIDRKPGSCGSVVPAARIRVGDDGEILVQGPLVFDRYFDDRDATDRAFTAGWFRTGDLADVDAEGYLTIVGRARDIIRTGGESVAPGEVERVIAAHPSVADVAVVGVPDTQWGEIVCAVVVAAAGTEGPDLDGLRGWCDGRLARFKHPRRLVLVDSIPRTASTNQVQRRLLAEQLT
jgi:acyl-CoA synthetase (AMP-forming)/AMP-acid ligase II